MTWSNVTRTAITASLCPGLVPGFAYMGLVEPSGRPPAEATPRQKGTSGAACGIAERQTAIYPLVSPGGLESAGRTATRLFDPQREDYQPVHPRRTGSASLPLIAIFRGQVAINAMAD